MSTPNPDYTDQGVVLSLTGDGSGTYVDKAGVSHNNGTLTTTYVAGTTFQCGRSSDFAAWVVTGFSAATSITVKIELQRVDANNPSLFSGWFPVQSERSDQVGVVAFEHTILPADLSSIRLLTKESRLSGNCRISAKAAGAGLTAADLVYVGVNALPR